ncbi:unnamed protein product [Albugo candida]|uniref:Uncharacterized protein n=1 Tax=Albugo candida TaxID=65357 RepID=A0A024G9I1_9STRA|nr:unnamed protein product [Albugo candida]|eukprot:CCI42972.1 unnamed protein product [Albugo candida]
MRDLATSKNWLLGIWNQLEMYNRVTTFAYFIFFCFWEFLPTILLLCLLTTKAGGVGAPRRRSSNARKLPDFGIFHIIIAGRGKNEGKWMASPLTHSYGSTRMASSSLLARKQPFSDFSSFSHRPVIQQPHWIHSDGDENYTSNTCQL